MKSKADAFHESIGRYPEYMAPDHPNLKNHSKSMLKLKQKLNPVNPCAGEDRRAFVSAVSKKTVPTPSIVCNTRNLRNIKSMLSIKSMR